MADLPKLNGRAIRLVLALLLAAPSGAQAQGPLFAYITGGIGLEERSAMQANRAAFNLQLTYALRPSGNYLAAVETLIAEPEGRIVLRVTSDGPFVWARLAPGTYAVAATYRGLTESRRITVPAQGAAAESFYWSDSQGLQ
jgi:hypothetical protein